MTYTFVYIYFGIFHIYFGIRDIRVGIILGYLQILLWDIGTLGVIFKGFGIFNTPLNKPHDRLFSLGLPRSFFFFY